MHQSRNTQAVKKFALVGAALAYAFAVLYGDVMFLQVVSVAFPASGIFGSLAIAGALVTAASALILPLALHYWFSPGSQFISGIIFWGIDVVALALNSMLAFSVASGTKPDQLLSVWKEFMPATPLLAVIGWGVMFLLDSSHKLRHAQAELEAAHLDVYSQQLIQAANDPSVHAVIIDAAQQAARNTAQQLHGNTLHLAPPTVDRPDAHQYGLPLTTEPLPHWPPEMADYQPLPASAYKVPDRKRVSKLFDKIPLDDLGKKVASALQREANGLTPTMETTGEGVTVDLYEWAEQQGMSVDEILAAIRAKRASDKVGTPPDPKGRKSPSV